MKRHIISISHNDLDGMGCELSVGWKYKGSHIHWLRCNYFNIDDLLDEARSLYSRYPIQEIFITDISFSDCREKLVSLASDLSDCNIHFIDHHLYPSRFFDDLPGNITVTHSTECSASLLTFNHLKLENRNLREMIDLIDIFDMHRDDHLYKKSVHLNDYFYANKKRTKDSIVKGNFKLPKDFCEWSERNWYEFNLEYEKMDRKNLKISDEVATFCFSSRFFPFITDIEFERGKKVVIIVDERGIFRIRFNAKQSIPLECKHEIKLECVGKTEIGHENAFSFKIEEVSKEKIVNKFKRIESIISKYI